MSGRSTRSVLSTSIRRSPRGANSFRQALISELLPVPRAPVSSTLLAPWPATNCSVLRSSRSFCGVDLDQRGEADRRDVAHRLERALSRRACGSESAIEALQSGAPSGCGSTASRRASAAPRRASIRCSSGAGSKPCGSSVRAQRSPAAATRVAHRHRRDRAVGDRERARGRSAPAWIGCMPVKAPNAGSTPTASPRARSTAGAGGRTLRPPSADARMQVAGQHVRAARRRAGDGRARSRRARSGSSTTRDAEAARRVAGAARRGCRAPARGRARHARARQRATAPSVAGACDARRMEEVAEEDDARRAPARRQRRQRGERLARRAARHRHAEPRKLTALPMCASATSSVRAGGAGSAAFSGSRRERPAAGRDRRRHAAQRLAPTSGRREQRAARRRGARSGCCWKPERAKRCSRPIGERGQHRGLRVARRPSASSTPACLGRQRAGSGAAATRCGRRTGSCARAGARSRTPAHRRP